METDGALPKPLTRRDLDILRGMVEGLTNVEIAERLVLSAATVRWYVKQLYAKLGAHSRRQAVAHAVALGLAKAPSAVEKATSDVGSGCPLINPFPQDVSDCYVGNAQKLALLATVLDQQPRLISIYGRAGSGKTALACKALGDLRQTEANWPRLSGIVCLSASSTGVTLSRLLADIGRLLPDRDQAVIEAISRNTELALAQRIGIVLEKVANKRIIVLLDNLEAVQRATTGELVDPGLQQFIETALTQCGTLTLLITSREPLLLSRSLKTREHLISLEDGLAPEDAVELLRKFDPSGVAGIRDAPSRELREIAGLLGGFPRGLEAVAGMLLADPLLRLADVKRDLESLDGEVSAAVVEHALAHLTEEALRVLQGLAIFGRPVRYEALAYLLAPYLPDSTVRATLGRLIHACFVKAHPMTQQLSLHPLDQHYCYNQIPRSGLNEGESLPFTRDVLHQRAADYYREHRLPQAAWQNLADLEPQINEFRQRVSAGEGDEAARIVLEIDREYLWEWGYKDVLRQLYPTLEGQVHDPHLAHQIARRLAWLKFFEAPQEADREFEDLLKSARRAGSVKEEADALDDLAQTFRRGSRDVAQGIEHHRQALALYRQIGDRRGEAEALGGLGAIYAQIEPKNAIGCLLAAADIQRNLRNNTSLSFVLTMLGTAYESLGAFEQAGHVLEEAIRIAQASGSLEALGRAHGGLARLCISMGDTERGWTCIEEAIATTREFAGVPMTADLMFWVSMTALYFALAGDAPKGIELLQQTMRDAATVLPDAVAFGNSFLGLLFLLGGHFQDARSLLPLEPRPRENDWSSSGFWIGVLLIKTGESEAATQVLTHVLEGNMQSYPFAPSFRRLEIGPQTIRALAHAGLALLNNDPGRAATAAELTRQGVRVRSWQTELYRALIKLLLQETGGEILLPIQDILASVPARK
jgi:DNA-binding CsgD family transcriptional regulator/tetratricopeptide (TPR) repeat protein